MRLIILLAFVAVYLVLSNALILDDLDKSVDKRKGDSKIGGKVQGGIESNVGIGGLLGIRSALKGDSSSFGATGKNGTSAGSKSGLAGSVEINIGGNAGITCGIQGSNHVEKQLDVKLTSGSASVDLKLQGGLNCSIGGLNINFGGSSGIAGQVGGDLKNAVKTAGKMRSNIQKKLLEAVKAVVKKWSH